MLCVQRWSDVEPSGIVRCWQVKCREPKTKRVQLYYEVDPLCPSRYIIYLQGKAVRRRVDQSAVTAAAQVTPTAPTACLQTAVMQTAVIVAPAQILRFRACIYILTRTHVALYSKAIQTSVPCVCGNVGISKGWIYNVYYTYCVRRIFEARYREHICNKGICEATVDAMKYSFFQ